MAQLLAAVLLCAIELGRTAPPARPDGAPLRLRWELQSAATSSALPHDSVLGIFSITNTGSKSLSDKGWALYFTCTEGATTGPLRGHLLLERVAVTLYRLRPSEGFS